MCFLPVRHALLFAAFVSMSACGSGSVDPTNQKSETSSPIEVPTVVTSPELGAANLVRPEPEIGVKQSAVGVAQPGSTDTTPQRVVDAVDPVVRQLPEISSATDAKGTTETNDNVDSGPNELESSTAEASIRPDSPTRLPDTESGLFVSELEGSDENSGSLQRPFRTIERALQEVGAGQFIFLREGTYLERGLVVNGSGLEQEPLGISNFSGERVIIDGSIPSFLEPGSIAWELHDPNTDTYRSVESNFGTQPYVANVRINDSEWHRIVTYAKIDSEKSNGIQDLIATNQTVSDLPRYVGPGISNEDGILYIRLAPVSTAALHGQASVAQFGLDPNNYSISVAPVDPVLTLKGQNIRINGLEITGSGKGIFLSAGTSNVLISDTTFVGLSLGIHASDGVSSIEVNHCVVDSRFPDYVAWTDMKGTAGQTKPAAHWANKLAGFSGEEIDNLVFANTLFNDTFDGLVVNGTNMQISNNTGFFYDDFIQLGSNSAEVKIFDNRLFGTGPAHNGRGISPSPGSVYIFGNTIDSRQSMLWGKQDPQGILRSNQSGWRAHTPFSNHTKSAVVNGDPWKIYNNTIIFNGSAGVKDAGYGLWGGSNTTGVDHEVYNNIFVETGGGTFAKDLSLSELGHRYDGNLYWRTNSVSSRFFDGFRASDGRALHFYSLQEFKSSSEFQGSKASYPPGWEVLGLEADPQLSVHFVPSATGPAAIAGVDLPSHFPRSDVDYRGAIQPR